MNTQEFLEAVAHSATPPYQPMLAGIANYYRVHQMLSAKQFVAVQAGANRARLPIPPDLCVQPADDGAVLHALTPSADATMVLQETLRAIAALLLSAADKLGGR